MSFYKAEQLNLRGFELEKKSLYLSVILFASVWDRHRRGMVWRADAENIMRGLCGGTWIIWYGRWATLPYGKVGIICHGLVLNCMVLHALARYGGDCMASRGAAANTWGAGRGAL